MFPGRLKDLHVPLFAQSLFMVHRSRHTGLPSPKSAQNPVLQSALLLQLCCGAFVLGNGDEQKPASWPSIFTNGSHTLVPLQWLSREHMCGGGGGWQ